MENHKNRTPKQKLSSLVFLLFMIMLSLSTTASGVEYQNFNYLPIQRIEQKQSNWCWAASSLAVIARAGNGWPPQQCEIVNSVKERTDCCIYPSSTPCNEGDFSNEALEDLGILSTRDEGSPYTQAQCAYEIIDNERPFIITWQRTTPGGTLHAIVAIGMSNDHEYLGYMDPSPGSDGGKWIVEYWWVHSNVGTHYWAHTTIINAGQTLPDDLIFYQTFDDDPYWYHSEGWIWAESVVIESDTPGWIWYTAEEKIYLRQGFKVEQGAYFSASIGAY